ncbi:MAG: glycosyltransferase [Candidatus Omnitrophota bacterium]
MIIYINQKRASIPFKAVALFVAAAIFITALAGYIDKAIPKTYASFLPAPTQLLEVSPAFNPLVLKGIKVYPDEPFKFDFILDSGDSTSSQKELKQSSEKLIKHFLASLTIPEEDLWVNLSPYEKERVIPQELGITELGKDLLAEDYILKQLMASITYPESPLGKQFWEKVYKKVYQLYGTTELPINTFNKIWIVPDKAVVYQEDSSAFVVESKLKVMLEEDYLALKNNLNNQEYSTSKIKEDKVKALNKVSSEVLKELILPEIEKEVNQGKNFAPLRQVYNSLILSVWFKKQLKESLVGQIYVNRKKTKGIDTPDKQIKEKIYKQYLSAYRQGVYNYIKDEFDTNTQQNINRRYYSGGCDFTKASSALTITNDPSRVISSNRGKSFNLEVMLETGVDGFEEKVENLSDGKSISSPLSADEVKPESFLSSLFDRLTGGKKKRAHEERVQQEERIRLAKDQLQKRFARFSQDFLSIPVRERYRAYIVAGVWLEELSRTEGIDTIEITERTRRVIDERYSDGFFFGLIQAAIRNRISTNSRVVIGFNDFEAAVIRLHEALKRNGIVGRRTIATHDAIVNICEIAFQRNIYDSDILESAVEAYELSPEGFSAMVDAGVPINELMEIGQFYRNSSALGDFALGKFKQGQRPKEIARELYRALGELHNDNNQLQEAFPGEAVTYVPAKMSSFSSQEFIRDAISRRFILPVRSLSATAREILNVYGVDSNDANIYLIPVRCAPSRNIMHNRAIATKFTRNGKPCAFVFKGTGLADEQEFARGMGIRAPFRKGNPPSVLRGGNLIQENLAYVGAAGWLRSKFYEYFDGDDPVFAELKNQGLSREAAEMFLEPGAQFQPLMLPVALVGRKETEGLWPGVAEGLTVDRELCLVEADKVLKGSGIPDNLVNEMEILLYQIGIPERIEELSLDPEYRRGRKRQWKKEAYRYREFFQYQGLDIGSSSDRRRLLKEMVLRNLALLRILWKEGYTATSRYGTIVGQQNSNPLFSFDPDTISKATIRKQASDVSNLLDILAMVAYAFEVWSYDEGVFRVINSNGGTYIEFSSGIPEEIQLAIDTLRNMSPEVFKAFLRGNFDQVDIFGNTIGSDYSPQAHYAESELFALEYNAYSPYLGVTPPGGGIDSTPNILQQTSQRVEGSTVTNVVTSKVGSPQNVALDKKGDVKPGTAASPLTMPENKQGSIDVKVDRPAVSSAVEKKEEAVIEKKMGSEVRESLQTRSTVSERLEEYFSERYAAAYTYISREQFAEWHRRLEGRFQAVTQAAERLHFSPLPHAIGIDTDYISTSPGALEEHVKSVTIELGDGIKVSLPRLPESAEYVGNERLWIVLVTPEAVRALSDQALTFLIAHEVGHRFYGPSTPEIELQVDRVATDIVVSIYGWNAPVAAVNELQKAFPLSETATNTHPSGQQKIDAVAAYVGQRKAQDAERKEGETKSVVSSAVTTDANQDESINRFFDMYMEGVVAGESLSSRRLGVHVSRYPNLTTRLISALASESRTDVQLRLLAAVNNALSNSREVKLSAQEAETLVIKPLCDGNVEAAHRDLYFHVLQYALVNNPDVLSGTMKVLETIKDRDLGYKLAWEVIGEALARNHELLSEVLNALDNLRDGSNKQFISFLEFIFIKGFDRSHITITSEQTQAFDKAITRGIDLSHAYSRAIAHNPELFDLVFEKFRAVHDQTVQGTVSSPTEAAYADVLNLSLVHNTRIKPSAAQIVYLLKAAHRTQDDKVRQSVLSGALGAIRNNNYDVTLLMDETGPLVFAINEVRTGETFNFLVAALEDLISRSPQAFTLADTQVFVDMLNETTVHQRERREALVRVLQKAFSHNPGLLTVLCGEKGLSYDHDLAGVLEDAPAGDLTLIPLLVNARKTREPSRDDYDPLLTAIGRALHDNPAQLPFVVNAIRDTSGNPVCRRLAYLVPRFLEAHENLSLTREQLHTVVQAVKYSASRDNLFNERMVIHEIAGGNLAMARVAFDNELVELLVRRNEEVPSNQRIDIERFLRQIAGSFTMLLQIDREYAIGAFKEILRVAGPQGLDAFFTRLDNLLCFPGYDALVEKLIKKAAYGSSWSLLMVFLDDEYAVEGYWRMAEDINDGMLAPYLGESPILHARCLLMRGAYEELRQLVARGEVSPDQILEAFLWNKQNNIISQTSDMAQSFAGERGVLAEMTPIAQKITLPTCTFTELHNTLLDAGVVTSEAGTMALLNAQGGFRLYAHRGQRLIVPVIFDNMNNVFRGSSEHDNAEANYVTHALSTAIVHYALRGGEIKDSHGAKAFHEFDLLFLELIGHKYRAVDTAVTLAFCYVNSPEADRANRDNAVPLPECARKRTQRIDQDTIANSVQKVMVWELAEKRAKQNIYKILQWIAQGRLSKSAIAQARAALEREVNNLRPNDEGGICGLRPAYFQTLFGYLDAQFLDRFQARLEADYQPGQDNQGLLQGLLAEVLVDREVVKATAYNATPIKMMAHPWIGRKITLFDYLKAEVGYLDRDPTTYVYSEHDVSTVKLEDFGQVSPSAAELAVANAQETVKPEQQAIAAINNSGLSQEYKDELSRRILLDGDTRVMQLLVQVAPQLAPIATPRGGGNLLDHTLYTMNSVYEDRTIDAMSLRDSSGAAIPIKRLMVIAALLHDIGKALIRSHSEHEQASVRYIRETLSSQFSEFEINLICYLVGEDIVGRTISKAISPAEADGLLTAGVVSLGIPKGQLFELAISFYCADIGLGRFGRHVFGVGEERRINFWQGRPIIPEGKYSQLDELKKLVVGPDGSASSPAAKQAEDITVKSTASSAIASQGMKKFVADNRNNPLTLPITLVALGAKPSYLLDDSSPANAQQARQLLAHLPGGNVQEIEVTLQESDGHASQKLLFYNPQAIKTEISNHPEVYRVQDGDIITTIKKAFIDSQQGWLLGYPQAQIPAAKIEYTDSPTENWSYVEIWADGQYLFGYVVSRLPLVEMETASLTRYTQPLSELGVKKVAVIYTRSFNNQEQAQIKQFLGRSLAGRVVISSYSENLPAEKIWWLGEGKYIRITEEMLAPAAFPETIRTILARDRQRLSERLEILQADLTKGEDPGLKEEILRREINQISQELAGLERKIGEVRVSSAVSSPLNQEIPSKSIEELRREKSTYQLATIAIREDGARAQEALQAIENLLQDGYIDGVSDLKNIARNKPGLINEGTVGILEVILRKPNVTPQAISFVCETLSVIVTSGVESVVSRKATKVLLDALNTAALDRTSYDSEEIASQVYSQVARTLTEIAIYSNNTNLIDMCFDTFERVLNENRLEAHSYSIATNALLRIVRKKSDRARASTIEAFERNLNASDRGITTHSYSLRAIVDLSQERSDLIARSTVDAVKLHSEKNGDAMRALAAIGGNQYTGQYADECIDEILRVLNIEGDFTVVPVVVAAAVAAQEFARKRSGLFASPTRRQALEHAAASRQRPAAFFGEIAGVYNVLFSQHPDWAEPATVATLEGIMKRDDLANDDYATAVAALTAIRNYNRQMIKTDSLAELLLQLPFRFYGHTFIHHIVYQSQGFKTRTSHMEDEERYEVGLAVYYHLRASGIIPEEASEAEIVQAFDFIIAGRRVVQETLPDDRQSQNELYSSRRTAVNIFHEEMRAEQTRYEALQTSSDMSSGQIHSYVGGSTVPATADVITDVKDAIITHKGPLTITFSGHANREGFALSPSQIISVEELAVWLIERGNLNNVNIVFDACYAHDFVDNLNRTLHNLGVSVDITTLAIAHKNKQAVGGSLRSIERYHSAGQPFTIGQAMRAMRRSDVFIHQVANIFCPRWRLIEAGVQDPFEKRTAADESYRQLPVNVGLTGQPGQVSTGDMEVLASPADTILKETNGVNPIAFSILGSTTFDLSEQTIGIAGTTITVKPVGPRTINGLVRPADNGAMLLVNTQAFSEMLFVLNHGTRSERENYINKLFSTIPNLTGDQRVSLGRIKAHFNQAPPLSREEQNVLVSHILIHEFTECYALRTGNTRIHAHTAAMMAEAEFTQRQESAGFNVQAVRDAFAPIALLRDIRQANTYSYRYPTLQVGQETQPATASSSLQIKDSLVSSPKEDSAIASSPLAQPSRDIAAVVNIYQIMDEYLRVYEENAERVVRNDQFKQETGLDIAAMVRKFLPSSTGKPVSGKETSSVSAEQQSREELDRARARISTLKALMAEDSSPDRLGVFVRALSMVEGGAKITGKNIPAAQLPRDDQVFALHAIKAEAAQNESLQRVFNEEGVLFIPQNSWLTKLLGLRRESGMNIRLSDGNAHIDVILVNDRIVGVPNITKLIIHEIIHTNFTEGVLTVFAKSRQLWAFYHLLLEAVTEELARDVMLRIALRNKELREILGVGAEQVSEDLAEAMLNSAIYGTAEAKVAAAAGKIRNVYRNERVLLHALMKLYENWSDGYEQVVKRFLVQGDESPMKTLFADSWDLAIRIAVELLTIPERDAPYEHQQALRMFAAGINPGQISRLLPIVLKLMRLVKQTDIVPKSKKAEELSEQLTACLYEAARNVFKDFSKNEEFVLDRDGESLIEALIKSAKEVISQRTRLESTDFEVRLYGVDDAFRRSLANESGHDFASSPLEENSLSFNERGMPMNVSTERARVYHGVRGASRVGGDAIDKVKSIIRQKAIMSLKRVDLIDSQDSGIRKLMVFFYEGILRSMRPADLITLEQSNFDLRNYILLNKTSIEANTDPRARHLLGDASLTRMETYGMLNIDDVLRNYCIWVFESEQAVQGYYGREAYFEFDIPQSEFRDQRIIIGEIPLEYARRLVISDGARKEELKELLRGQGLGRIEVVVSPGFASSALTDNSAKLEETPQSKKAPSFVASSAVDSSLSQTPGLDKDFSVGTAGTLLGNDGQVKEARIAELVAHLKSLQSRPTSGTKTYLEQFSLTPTPIENSLLANRTIIQLAPDLKADGISRYAIKLIGMLAARNPGLTQVVFYPDSNKTQETKTLEIGTSKILFIPFAIEEGHELDDLENKISAYVAQDSNVELVVSHLQEYHYGVSDIVTKRNLPFLAYLHNATGFNSSEVWDAAEKYLQPYIFEKLVNNPLVRILTVNPASPEDIRQRFPNARVDWIGPLFEDNNFNSLTDLEREAVSRYLREQYFMRDDDVFILVPNSLDSRKGLPEILDALEGLQFEHFRSKKEFLSGVKVLFVGLGSEQRIHDIEQEIRRRDLTGIAYVAGAVPQEMLRFLYGRANGVLLYSRREGFALVPLEAASMGVPVIGSDIPGVRESIVDRESGLLVPWYADFEQRADALKDGLSRFMSLAPQDRLAWGRRATQHVEQFKPEEWIGRHEETYSETIQDFRQMAETTESAVSSPLAQVELSKKSNDISQSASSAVTATSSQDIFYKNVEDFLSSKKVRLEQIQSILRAMQANPRADFIDMPDIQDAYSLRLPAGYRERALPSGPYLGFVASLLNLKGDEKILHVGTGSGWMVAVLADLLNGGKNSGNGKIYTVEIDPAISRDRQALISPKYQNVEFIRGDAFSELDGIDGIKFDRIIVDGSLPGGISKSLFNRLSQGSGMMVVPVSTGNFSRQPTYAVYRVVRFGPRVFYNSFTQPGWNFEDLRAIPGDILPPEKLETVSSSVISEKTSLTDKSIVSSPIFNRETVEVSFFAQDAAEKVIEAFRDGRVVVLNLKTADAPDLNSANKEIKRTWFKKVKARIENFVHELPWLRPSGNIFGRDIRHPLREMLKNAFFWGNHFNLSLPIGLSIELNDSGKCSKVEVYDTNVVPKPLMVDVSLAHEKDIDLAGATTGTTVIQNIVRYQIFIGKVIDETIQGFKTLAVITPKESAVKKPAEHNTVGDKGTQASSVLSLMEPAKEAFHEEKVSSALNIENDPVAKIFDLRLSQPISRETEWTRIVTPAEALDFHQKWQSSSQGYYAQDYQGKTYNFPLKAWEKMVAWSGRSPDFERKGYFIARSQGDIIEIVDFIPVGSIVMSPRIDNYDKDDSDIEQVNTSGIGTFFPGGERGQILMQRYGINLVDQEILSFESVARGKPGLISMPYHSHFKGSKYPEGPSKLDRKSSKGVDFVYALDSGRGFIFDKNSPSQEVLQNLRSVATQTIGGDVGEETTKDNKTGGIDPSTLLRVNSSESKPGGIDFNPKYLELEVKGSSVKFGRFNIPFDIKKFEGFSFRIINIKAIHNLSSILKTYPVNRDEAQTQSDKVDLALVSHEKYIARKKEDRFESNLYK